MKQERVAGATNTNKGARGGAVQIEERCIEAMDGDPAIFMRIVLDDDFISPPLAPRIQKHPEHVRIVKKLIGEVPDCDSDMQDVDAFARFMGCDIALELRGEPIPHVRRFPGRIRNGYAEIIHRDTAELNSGDGIDPFDIICAWGPVPHVKGKLWLWSITVIRDKKTNLSQEDEGAYSPLSSPVIPGRGT
ncbi:hypothetical protein [Candidatus Methanoperedens nitratireducens]|uniref:Uncharacterized protein n=1 Tax=Candidatus Methanoperedens nitratireducens TaxID=1392998 RepID=A0A284VRS6_9EURY|nr:hypothetical protein [Candidatus Methanoperedens nitroreducens]SNQ61887.1 hypothetical protein MNV_510003 [Candidatus Methanoperedens nitroreducens]